MASDRNVEEILRLEEELRMADLSSEPDTSSVHVRLLSDSLVMIGPHGQLVPKDFIVKGHRPPQKQPFTRVDLSEIKVIPSGDSYLVTARGDYSVGGKSFSLRFLRVWQKNAGQWQIVAGSVTGL